MSGDMELERGVRIGGGVGRNKVEQTLQSFLMATEGSPIVS
jgi:hypothetical protein